MEDIVMFLKLNAITAAIQGANISLNIHETEQISCFSDIYFDLADDISTGRNIHLWTWSRIMLTQIYKCMV